MQKIFSTTKLADIVLQDETLLLVLGRLGINPGFEDNTIHEVCKKNGLHTNFLVCLLNTITNENFDPAEELQTFSLLQLTEYLQSENEYFKNRLNIINMHINMLLQSANDSNINGLSQLFTTFKEGMLDTLSQKELLLFPSVVHLYETYYSPECKKQGMNVPDFETENQQINSDITTIKNYIIKNVTGTYDNGLLFSVLYMFSQFEKEIFYQQQIEKRLLKKLIIEINGHIEKKKNNARNTYISLPAKRDILTSREKEVLTLVAQGNTNKEIANKLEISLHTVLSHRKNITQKLSIKTIPGLTTYALANGLIMES